MANLIYSQPQIHIHQVCSNVSSAAKTPGGTPVKYCLSDVGDIVTLNRHIDLIREYGDTMGTKAQASVADWMETLANPKTYEDAGPGKKPFLWYHRQTMLEKKKAAAPVTEAKQEGRVEQEAKVGKEMTSTGDDKAVQSSKAEKQKSVKPPKTQRGKPGPSATDDQPGAGGSRGLRSGTRAAGQS